MPSAWVWMRHETRETERRAPVVPDDARRLVEAGVRLTVEESPQRAFPIEDYVAAGAEVAPAGSWAQAPAEVLVLGLKELPGSPAALRHRHIYFGHAFKGQAGAPALLDRFRAGGGTLLDLEYLVDDSGRRVAAFGYWAGYVGAALGALHRRGELTAPLQPTSREELDRLLAGRGPGVSRGTVALVIGARGRSGTGAQDALRAAGLPVVGWDRAETLDLDRELLLGHDLLVNCVHATVPGPPFVRPADVEAPGRRLTTIVDVTADTDSELNLLPVYRETTSWDAPVRRLAPGVHGVPPLDVIAIDNLPSLLPVEASRSYSADLLPHVVGLALEDDRDGVWERARARYATAVARPMTPPSGATTLRDRLRSALSAAIRRRDRAAIGPLRSVLSAIDNAEAVELPGSAQPSGSAHIAGSAVGVGAGETARADLTEGEIEAIVHAEVQERLTAAEEYERIGRAEHAARLRAEARTVTDVVDSAQGSNG